MRYSQSALLAALPLLPSLASGISLDCKKVLADGVKWSFEPLGGAHSVSWVRNHLNAVANTTFKIDLCHPLTLDGDEKKQCGEGTQICGTETQQLGDTATTIGSFPIWRQYVHEGSVPNPKATRLKTSASNSDSQKEGLRLDVGGGKYDGRSQRAVIEFLCLRDGDKTKRDDEGKDGEDGGESDGEDGGKEEEKNPEWEEAKKADDGAGGSIEFLSWQEDTLRLNWHTPFGCEDAASSGGGDSNSSSGGWGFFSWFFFIIFMLLIAYIGFSAWINYSRNGARGWDLLPHSDTIRDVPYIVGDWGRKIVSTLSGGGTRGGYSAV